jgi:pSer/pThr/pTyr-binding forkhead associated (FHA) protein
MKFRKVTVGRSRDNDVVLNHPSVSRHHLEFFFDPEGNVFLTDLNSSNGTFVNGRRISGSVQLRSTDIVKAGMSEPIPWKNFQRSGSSKLESTGPSKPIYYDQPVNAKPSNVSPLKVVLITLSVILLLGVGGFLINEFVLSDAKPVAVDPALPNDEAKHPKKRQKDEAKEITYDLSCLEDEDDMGSTSVIDALETIDSDMTEAFGGEVSIAEEEEIGDQLLKDCRKQYRFIDSGKKIANLRALLDRLVKEIKKPKGYHYQIYLIDSDELNAFTAGAKIFVTTRMYSFCKSNDELACIIGHEINHNELGHIKQYVQKARLLTEEGAALAQMITMSFNQKKETMCDLTGIDLVIAAGYNGCVNIELWKRMKAEADEGDYNALENLFRTHPYSDKRANCSEHHIKTNYDFDCKGN